MMSSDPFNVLLVGAGNVIFGSDEGPWNHTLRLELKLLSRLRVVAVIDPAIGRATAALEKKRSSSVEFAYRSTRVFPSLRHFVDDLTAPDRPLLIVIGSPPSFRGSLQTGRDLESEILSCFPGVPLFIEKPVATGAFQEVSEVFAIAKKISDSGTICSVGYMLRYLRAVQTMKCIIRSNDLTVMATIARYACAYTSIAKPDWWDKSKSAGPIVEQATHFCDLSRYFGGDVDIASIAAHSLEWNEGPGRLSNMAVNEDLVDPEHRISRVTSATWKYTSGAVGSLTHVVALHGKNYSCELEVYADGYALKLVNPYVQPVLHVRAPDDDSERTFTFPDDDPFFSEVSHLVDIVEDVRDDANPAQILSSYDDAARTYEFTWAIRLAAERSRGARLQSV